MQTSLTYNNSTMAQTFEYEDESDQLSHASSSTGFSFAPTSTVSTMPQSITTPLEAQHSQTMHTPGASSNNSTSIHTSTSQPTSTELRTLRLKCFEGPKVATAGGGGEPPYRGGSTTTAQEDPDTPFAPSINLRETDPIEPTGQEKWYRRVFKCCCGIK